MYDINERQKVNKAVTDNNKRQVLWSARVRKFFCEYHID